MKDTLFDILIHIIGSFLAFFFGVILVFLLYPALKVIPFLSRLREAIAGFGLIIPTILACWLIALLRRYRKWKAFIPSLSIGFVISILILTCDIYLSWFPNSWFIFTPWGIIIVVISSFLGGAFVLRGKILMYLFLVFFISYSFLFGLTVHTRKLSSQFYSYEIKVPSENITLGATLTIPKSRSSLKWPGIVLIHGSGKQDRDETFGLFNATFKEMAQFFSEKGFAVIRYDKRGVGQSGGHFESAGLYDFARDAENVFNYMKSRKELNSSLIFLIGHSYGGKVATMVASNRPEVAGLVLLACVASSEPYNLIRQNKFISEVRGESQHKRKARFEGLNFWVEKVKSRELILYKDYFSEKGLSKEFQKIQKFNPLPPVWMLQAMEYDQLKTLEKLEMPILIISGTSDWMVPPSETELLEEALERVHHPDFEVSIFPEVDHRFIRIESAERSYKMMTLSSIKDLFRDYPIHQPVLKKIFYWLNNKLRREKNHGSFFHYSCE
ncbi:MAG: alpha/beta fold hydrolase [Candidatus Aminicenantaceae bacterium]